MTERLDLQELRRRLDAVDRRLLEDLAERRSLVAEVAAYKSSGDTVLRDRSREESLLQRLVDLGKGLGLEPYFVTRVFQEILDHSLRLQHELLARAADPARGTRPLVVGFQGGEGAFSHLASKRFFAMRGDATFMGWPTFRAMLEAVRDGDLDYALLPIENTTAGSINESYDLLAEMDLHLVGKRHELDVKGISACHRCRCPPHYAILAVAPLPSQNTSMSALEHLAGTMVLGALLEEVRKRYGAFDLLAHWKQGEFHHDVVFRLHDEPFDLPGAVLVVATNCNGGIKEVLSFSEVPERWALWRHRCPDNPDFEGSIPLLLGLARTHHWFDPCELLTPDARSELRPEHRRRQRGGGWEPTY